MHIELEEWQARLALHFATLRDSRRARGIAEPLFGLEHGLIQAEVEELESAVRAHIAHRRPSQNHWLAWIVYSAELGYRYSGDEYWQTFEQETPGWLRNGDRYRIRDFYQRFAREFSGAVPSGPWAEHFSIICWPITHAILPKDLQIQLARTLFDSRFLLNEDILRSPELLGEVIAARSWNASSRFQNLAQGTRLLGQIAAALLIQGQAGTTELIYPATLERISEDLDRERQAREWLRKARSSVNERVRIRGLGSSPSSRTAPSSINQVDEARSAVAVLGIEPRLMARPTDATGASWDVLLEIPALSHLLLRFPQTRDILTGSRCMVAGSAGRPLARGRLLHGAQQVRLGHWPKPDEVLLQFEGADTQLDFLLRMECLLRPGPIWLLRVAADGLAYERKSLRVRPGERYILLSTVGPIETDEYVTQIELACEGIHAAMLDVPEALETDWQEAILNLGLGQARTIEVWPAGLAAAAWDGDGHGEWFASEQPCLAILADHRLASVRVSMDASPPHSFELASLNPGEPLFLELPRLPVGIHRIKFSAQSGLAGQPELLDDQEAVIRIREDLPQTHVADNRGPLLVQIDPAHPTMEELWDGEVEVLLRGPQHRDVESRLSLFERNGGAPILVKQLPPIALPVDTEDWQKHFDRYVRSKEEVQEGYDSANVCALEFKAGDLGGFTLRCERPFTPLRWALRRDSSAYVARLYDDSGESDHPVLSRVAFETPCNEQRLPFETDIQAPDRGGMYVAQTPKHGAAIIVPPVLRQSHGFADLALSPHIEPSIRSPDSAVRVIEFASLWTRARLPGNVLAAFRRQKVLATLVFELFRLLGGDNWARAEEEATSRGTDPGELKALSSGISRDPTESGAGAVLLREAQTLAHQGCGHRVDRLSSVALEYRLLPESIRRTTTIDPGAAGVVTPKWLAELALRLASDPASAQLWAGPELRTGLNHLMDSPSLPRAARLAVIATDLYMPPGSPSGALYSGWRWA